VTTNDVAWAPGAAQYGAPGGWPPHARPGPNPAALLRLVSGGLAVVAGALLAGGTFPAMAVFRRQDFEGTSTTSSQLSGWGWTADGESFTTGRELLFGIPVVLAAVLLVVAGAVGLISARRSRHRSRAVTSMVGAVALTTGVFWTLSSYVSDSVALYRELDLEGWSAARSSGYWLELTGFVLAIFALAAVLVAALLDSPRRRAHVAAAPPAPDAAALYAPGPYAAPGQWAPAPTAPPAWPAPAPSPWGETR